MTDLEKALVEANDAMDGVYADIVTRYIRERYTISDELALLRQQNEKPDEYVAYYEYCELCKARAKSEVGIL